ncbi:MAG: hypothetical protein HN932_05530 [Candidatus Marinimicrobia bacterium]|jgi:hypothetical protein|nr:hypothetical protein [Candidatus Neomarinimicrobiota bacterium]MBT7706898.1 hypothetical protein [archaeon]
MAQIRARVRLDGYPERKVVKAWAADYDIVPRTMQAYLSQLRREGVERNAPEELPREVTGERIDMLVERRALLATVRQARGRTTNGLAIVSLVKEEKCLLQEIFDAEEAARAEDEQSRDWDARLEDLRRDLTALPVAARRQIRDIVIEVCGG